MNITNGNVILWPIFPKNLNLLAAQKSRLVAEELLTRVTKMKTESANATL